MHSASGGLDFKLVVTWVVLLLVTLLASVINGQVSDVRLGTVIILLIAGFKIHLIFSNFMEIKWPHKPWWKVLHIWLFICVAMLVGGFIYSAM